MNFKMDEQSYRDLNVFRSHENEFSLFDIFKRTHTVGGRARIEEMMRNPSNSIDDLQKRVEAIDFFCTSNLKLNINHDQFDLILHYLNYDRGQLRGNILDSFFPWLSNRIKPNQNYYIVEIGINYLLSLLNYASELSSTLIAAKAPVLLLELAYEIRNVLEKPDIRYAGSLASNQKLTFYQLGKLDSLIRKDNRLLLLKFLTLFYEFDALTTLAKARTAQGLCLPTYVNDQNITFQAEGLFHPALAEPVKNSIKIDENNNLIFLSGSNMAGKSSLLKSVGISVYLAHLGFPIPASSMKTSIFNGLLTTINLADTIENGLSHYYSEVIRVKKIASLLVERKGMFVILDELFKGTNAKDAFEGSLLVLNGFSLIKSSIFIISSHITELAMELKATTIGFKYMEHLMINEAPRFTYHLKDGVSADGIGMYFIEKEGICGLLQQAAKLG